ncbi:MAG: ATP-binding protein [Gammaproteobacteria bacterium]|nr:ATP-binding protein [Gammaproteobacteria bacterium]
MKLRTLIFGALVLVSVLPVGILAYWEYQTAIDNAFTVVENQHKVIARNLTIALERYAKDTRSAFQLATENLQNPGEIEKLAQLLSELYFRHIYSIDTRGKIQNYQCALTCPADQQSSNTVLLSIKDTLQAAANNRGKAFFSKIVPNPVGEPTIYLVKKMPNGNIAIGEIASTYFIELQRAVAFGEKGHAAIFDQTGRVIAHPLPGWVKSRKDLSRVSIVQKMINGGNGVTMFYSPAIKANMVAGYNVVPGIGGGVMVPQPESEILLHANSNSKAALAIAILGVFLASFLSWWLSGILSKPMRLLSKAAYSVAEGNLPTRAVSFTKLGLSELLDLEKSFNQMIANVVRKNAELEKLSHDAIRSSNYKSEFISSMNHELRTPMNSVLGFAQMLEIGTGNPLSENQKSSVEHIIRNGNHLLELIDHMLDFNKIEKGELPIDIEDVPAREVIDASLYLIKTRASQEGIEIIDQTVDQDLPLLSTDNTRLIQVLLNLLSNAVKYNSEQGKVALSCRRTVDQMLRISVADTGMGIPPEKRDGLFDPFDRLGRELGQIDGTGIGLSITKKIIELMGGKIGFESQHGKGSTFWVEVPLSSNQSPDENKTGVTDTVGWKAGPKIGDSPASTVLYVEDNPENVILMDAIISQMGNIQMINAFNATLGFDLATSKYPDLILMDINLPGMNGIQALNQLLRTRQTKDIPVIAITSSSTPKDVEAGLEAGFKAYITKPINVPEFIRTIEKILGEVRKSG